MTAAQDAACRRRAGGYRAPRLSRGSEWADRNHWLTTGGRPGRWKCLRWQVDILDDTTNPEVDWVDFMKSAQVGATQMGLIVTGQRMAERPSSMLFMQPTIPDAAEFSQSEFGPMCEAVPCLRGLVREPRTKGSDTKALFKRFPGGMLRFRGANAPTGLRRFGADTVLGDEADGWPATTSEGDPLLLALQRTKDFPERLIFIFSTPVHPMGRIHTGYLAGDRRRFHVPCLKCGVLDVLIPWLPEGHERTPDGSPAVGHQMTWTRGKPHGAHFVCSACSREMPASDRAEMIENGEWRASQPGAVSEDGRLRRSYHAWAAMSPAPNAALGQIAARLEAAGDDPDKLRAVANLDLGLPFTPKGESPEWQHLFDRREGYQIGTVPAGVALLTAGVDVQANRLEYEVVGWAPTMESWSIEAGVIEGTTNTDSSPVWSQLTEIMLRAWPGANGAQWTIRKLAIDSGYNTDRVYNWVKRHRMVAMAIKGMGEDKASADAVLSVAPAAERKPNGKVMKTGVVPWRVGAGRVKTELYGWLGLPRGEEERPPAGYCHFPQYDRDYFIQLTAEEKVIERDDYGRIEERWQVKPGCRNEGLDRRVYARAAAEHQVCKRDLAVAALEAPASTRPAPAASAPPSPAPAHPAAVPTPAPPAPPPTPDRFALDESRRRGSFDRPWRR